MFSWFCVERLSVIGRLCSVAARDLRLGSSRSCRAFSRARTDRSKMSDISSSLSSLGSSCEHLRRREELAALLSPTAHFGRNGRMALLSAKSHFCRPVEITLESCKVLWLLSLLLMLWQTACCCCCGCCGGDSAVSVPLIRKLAAWLSNPRVGEEGKR